MPVRYGRIKEYIRSTQKVTDLQQTVILYLVRHGQTMLNLLDRSQGWADSPLTPAGEEAAARLGEGLRREGVRFTAAWSSDSGRARETARILLAHMGQGSLPCTADKRFREWCLGDLEGRPNLEFLTSLRGYDGQPIPLEDLNHRLPEAVDCVHKDHDSTGMSQSFSELSARLLDGLRTAAEAVAVQGGGAGLIVSHALSIKTLVHLLVPERMDEAGYLRNASVCRFAYEDGDFRALELNDVHYLEDGQP